MLLGVFRSLRSLRRLDCEELIRGPCLPRQLSIYCQVQQPARAKGAQAAQCAPAPSTLA